MLIDSSVWQGRSINPLFPISIFGFYYLVILLFLLYTTSTPASLLCFTNTFSPVLRQLHYSPT